ncbi:hypothetical protein HU200_014863 [Digitaria exilis]|uniref:DUF6598 domain-containing protein n=1 Tax=Digitaria exilis TaxID=1010633 RepID=A0A835FAT9_9POAL|nr:hypothetical protein HU200_014863 [Digitaria exilis]
MTVLLPSCLSTVALVYSPVQFGVEASLEIKVLNGASSFDGKVTVCTTESKDSMILYDSEVKGTQKNLGTGGSVALTRRIVAVPMDEAGLVLHVSYGCEGYECIEIRGTLEGRGNVGLLVEISDGFVLISIMQIKVQHTGYIVEYWLVWKLSTKEKDLHDRLFLF